MMGWHQIVRRSERGMSRLSHRNMLRVSTIVAALALASLIGIHICVPYYRQATAIAALRRAGCNVVMDSVSWRLEPKAFDWAFKAFDIATAVDVGPMTPTL